MGNKQVEATPADGDDKIEEAKSVGWFSRACRWVRRAVGAVIGAVFSAPSGAIDAGISVVQTVATATVAILPTGLLTVPIAALIALGIGSIGVFRAIYRRIREPESLISGTIDVGVSVAQSVGTVALAIIRPASALIPPGFNLLLSVIRVISRYIREQEANGCPPNFNGNRYLMN